MERKKIILIEPHKLLSNALQVYFSDLIGKKGLRYDIEKYHSPFEIPADAWKNTVLVLFGSQIPSEERVWQDDLIEILRGDKSLFKDIPAIYYTQFIDQESQKAMADYDIDVLDPTSTVVFENELFKRIGKELSHG